jgi:hypothetical protein
MPHDLRTARGHVTTSGTPPRCWGVNGGCPAQRESLDASTSGPASSSRPRPAGALLGSPTMTGATRATLTAHPTFWTSRASCGIRGFAGPRTAGGLGSDLSQPDGNARFAGRRPGRGRAVVDHREWSRGTLGAGSSLGGVRIGTAWYHRLPLRYSGTVRPGALHRHRLAHGRHPVDAGGGHSVCPAGRGADGAGGRLFLQ